MIEMVIEQRRRDLGDGFEVGRLLPFAKRRMIGAFIFFELGVVMFLFVIGLELRPHKLWAMRGQIFGLGLAQVVAAIAFLSKSRVTRCRALMGCTINPSPNLW